MVLLNDAGKFCPLSSHKGKIHKEQDQAISLATFYVHEEVK